ncbi:MAG: hypothetical protein Q4P33_07890 [Flaviflexus sp.]|nr:hypothetical protein [Flaviflexus sp.]
MTAGNPYPPQPARKSAFSALPWILGILLSLALIGAGAFILLRGNGGVEREEYQTGVAKVLAPVFSGELTDEQIAELTSCITARTFDEVSEETREMIARGEDILPGNPDHQTIFDASSACTVEISIEAERQAEKEAGAVEQPAAPEAPGDDHGGTPQASEGSATTEPAQPPSEDHATPPPAGPERKAYEEAVRDMVAENLSSMLTADQIGELAHCLAEKTYDDASATLRKDVLDRVELTPENPEHAPLFAMLPVCAESTGVYQNAPAK